MQAGGAALAQLVVLASTPLLTRLYTEEDFGGFEVYAALVTIVSVIATGRLFEAIVLPRTDLGGYRFQPGMSEGDRLVFLRAEAQSESFMEAS